ncbi:MAG: hypothetical protein KatS3mg004_3052 [Bryobacteraceae bacterium]|nr:MAG: hypothetical protein KatS3mg004_3052 [Bryobacteraceae bacterium]
MPWSILGKMATFPPRRVKPAVASMPHVSLEPLSQNRSPVPLRLDGLRLTLRR